MSPDADTRKRAVRRNRKNFVEDNNFSTLAAQPYVSLESYRRDGSGVRTPVWHVVFDDRLYVFTERASWKVKRILRSPGVALAACDWRGGSPGLWLPGQARVIGSEPARGDEAQLIQRVYGALDAKYGWQMRLTNAASRLAGRIDGRCELEITATQA
ncbi:MAG: PPOX class probable F420-dependent enzyme [Hyphomicrobiaceae bacterium]